MNQFPLILMGFGVSQNYAMFKLIIEANKGWKNESLLLHLHPESVHI